MGLNETVSAERIHIGFFGVRNAGKSSLVNAVTNQEMSVVSDIKGTTTDPVSKAMELLPLGPVVITDTPGIDDGGELGDKRVKKAKAALESTDIAVLVCDALIPLSQADRELVSLFRDRDIPYVIVRTKSDLLNETRDSENENQIYVSSVTGKGINLLKEKLGSYAAALSREKYIIADTLPAGATAVLVIPVDASAPKGRLILPQQQVLRELLDFNMKAICCQPEELEDVLSSLNKAPDIVITDSQAFAKVSAAVPENINLTSFSILFAKYKGNLPELINGANALSALKPGSRILISEGCTHHRQCEDIGTVKIPKMINSFTGAEHSYTFTSGKGFPDSLKEYDIVVHCGGCMLSEKEMQYRIKKAVREGVPIVNYGILIATVTGILPRSTAMFI